MLFHALLASHRMTEINHFTVVLTVQIHREAPSKPSSSIVISRRLRLLLAFPSAMQMNLATTLTSTALFRAIAANINMNIPQTAREPEHPLQSDTIRPFVDPVSVSIFLSRFIQP